MSDRWTSQLSDYLDGELGGEECRLLAAHLVVCPECTNALEDLKSIATRARTLPSASPSEDLWPGIEARLRSAAAAVHVPVRPHRPRFAARRFSFSLPQLAAACVALAVLSGGAVWYALSYAPSRVPGSLAGRGDSSAVLAASTGADHLALQDVEELRTLLSGSREKLDPATVRSLEESLTIIDVAIRQAKRALEADPHNPYVKAHLDDTMRRKVNFLRRATMLASASQ
ncbi:MAG: zf-HC2 domain-containing protein [Candidatus Eiseniibacteriota bacterium]